jgi:CheY-like chemotaxis protein
MSVNVLVLDDEPTWRDLITEVLQEEGHIVQPVENLSQAREWLDRRQFHLAVIDIVLHEGEDGLDLLEDIARLNREAYRLCGPVVFTGFPTQDRAIKALRRGALDFRLKLEKPEESIVLKRGERGRGFVEQELLNAARKVLREVVLQRSRQYAQSEHTLHFHLVPGRKTIADLSGPMSFSTESERVLEIDINAFADRTDDLQFHFSAPTEQERLKWRTRARAISRDLHAALFSNDAELATCLASARDRSRGSLRLAFRGSRDLIRLPLELLPGETGYLVAENPLIRQIAGVRTVRKRGIDRVFLDETPEVKILLIGSNTYPPIPGVDEEIALLDDALPKLLQSRGFRCRIQTIPTEEASYENVRGCLERCQYHMVHYAGHGTHHETNTDESGIAFWEHPNHGGRVKSMPIRVLRNHLAHSDVQFIYLSCCVGAKSAPEASVGLSGNDFQGITEGLVRVGVPAVLGYRWNLSDTDAKSVALSFYEGVFTDLRLDIALFKARRALQEDNYYSETWASPVLVAQNL